MKRILAGLAIAVILMTAGIIWMDEKPSTQSSTNALIAKKWNWVSTTYSDGKIVKPLKANRFTLTFLANGTFGATTDCNGISGSYIAKGKYLSFTNMVSTLMGCPPSQEREFTDMLQQTQSFFVTSGEQLTMQLKLNNGKFIFN